MQAATSDWLPALVKSPVWALDGDAAERRDLAIIKGFLAGRFRPCACWLLQTVQTHNRDTPETTPERLPYPPTDPLEGGEHSRRQRRTQRFTQRDIGLSIGVRQHMISQVINGTKSLDADAWTGLLARFRGLLRSADQPTLAQRVCCGYADAVVAASVIAHDLNGPSNAAPHLARDSVLPLVVASWLHSRDEQRETRALSSVTIATLLTRYRVYVSKVDHRDWLPDSTTDEVAAKDYCTYRDDIHTLLGRIGGIILAHWGTEPDGVWPASGPMEGA